ncbi:hypothetical protein [Microbulbifer pacificus]|uniref:hypothetical protein n=1 Tax=Microbulbifer pacificus TaxID=407164 RepID=UPI000CF420A7|nr:hypothetical protein [Microbulbifer pacificus]
MIYFSIKSDRKFLEGYYESARKYLLNKNKEFFGATVEEINGHIGEMNRLREELARGLPRVKRLASIFQIPVVAMDPVSRAQAHAFTTILNNDADGLIEDGQKLDLLNETIGSCNEVERSQLLKIINPLYWILASITKILRLPFWIFETAGFKLESFEKSLAGSIVKLIEIAFIFGLLIYLGFSEIEIKEVVKGWLDV